MFWINIIDEKYCSVYSAIINDKCIDCNDVNNGGVKNCKLCQENEKGDKILCKQCDDEYILFSNSNTCLERNASKEIEEFNSCLELESKNNKLICSRCKPQFSLIQNGSEFKCIYTPTLYDSNFPAYYYYKKISPISHFGSQNIIDFLKTDYLYRRTKFYPCKESINLGTEQNPLYSCTKCYNVFENEEYELYRYTREFFTDDYNYYHYYYYYDYPFYYDDDENDEGYIYNSLPVKIDDKMISNSYCIIARTETKNCTEATYEISNGKEIYNCTKCMNDNLLLYNKASDTYYCSYNNETNENKCLVSDCKTCIINNPYFCSSCINSEYEVNKYSGACVKKTEIEPAITWKDIYRLEMNGQKEINGQIIEGPSLTLRGITTSQINTNHAFLVYLTFKLKNSLRNLEDKTKKIKAICETNKEVKEGNDIINIVDYDCIGTEPVNDNYEFTGIEGDNINNDIAIKNPNKENSDYSQNNLPLLFIIEKNNIDNQNFTNEKIDFYLNGKLNKLETSTNKKITNQKNIQMELKEIDDKVLCDFTRDEKNLEANFTCNLEIKNNNLSSTNLTFKNNEIKINDDVNLYINSLNKLSFSYENIEEPLNFDTRKKSSSNKTTIIVVCVVVGVVVLCGIVFISLYCAKFKKKNNVNFADSNIEKTNGEKSFNNASNYNMNEV